VAGSLQRIDTALATIETDIVALSVPAQRPADAA
jgi:hypothetical protein